MRKSMVMALAAAATVAVMGLTATAALGESIQVDQQGPYQVYGDVEAHTCYMLGGGLPGTLGIFYKADSDEMLMAISSPTMTFHEGVAYNVTVKADGTAYQFIGAGTVNDDKTMTAIFMQPSNPIETGEALFKADHLTFSTQGKTVLDIASDEQFDNALVETFGCALATVKTEK